MTKAIYYLILLIFLFTASIHAQIDLAGTTTYSQDFNTLVNSGSATFTSYITLNGWQWGSGSGTYSADDGSLSTNGRRAYGSTGSSDRAMGSLSVSSSYTYTLSFYNNTGATINQFRVRYKGEQWRVATTSADVLAFSYYFGFGGAKATNVAVSELNFSPPILSSTASALDGNLPANSAALDYTITGVNLLPGDYINFQWRDVNITGLEQGVAIDDIIIDWELPTGPQVSISDTVLTGIEVIDDGTSTIEAFTLNGLNLTKDLTISASAEFEVSIDDSLGVYFPSLTISQSLGGLANQPVSVYVRSNRSDVGSNTGVITISSTDIVPITVDVTTLKLKNYYLKPIGSPSLLTSWTDDSLYVADNNPPSFYVDGLQLHIQNRNSASFQDSLTINGEQSTLTLGNNADTLVFIIESGKPLNAKLFINSGVYFAIEDVNSTFPLFEVSNTRTTCDFKQNGTYTIPAANYSRLKISNGNKFIKSPSNTYIWDSLIVDNCSLYASSNTTTTLNLYSTAKFLNTVNFGFADSLLGIYIQSNNVSIDGGGNTIRVRAFNAYYDVEIIRGSNTKLLVGNPGSSGGVLINAGHSLNLNDNTLAFFDTCYAAFSGTGKLKTGYGSVLDIKTYSVAPGTVYLDADSNSVSKLKLDLRRTGFLSYLTVGSNLRVLDSINIKKGILIVDTTKQLTLSGLVVAETDTSYIKGIVKVTKSINGNSSDFNGIGFSIDASSNAVNLGSVEVLRYNHRAVSATGQVGIKRFWSITPSQLPTSPVSLAFSWLSPEDNGKNLANGSIWQTVDYSIWSGVSSPGNLSTHSALFSTANLPIAGSQWTISDNTSALPVELTSFEVKTTERGVDFKWVTATEHNSNKFVVEASKDNIWSVLGEVKATGNSNVKHSYSYSTSTLAAGKYQFRVKMVDNDGAVNYSNIVNGEVSIPSVYELSQNYPNPFNPSTMISYRLPFDSEVELSVYSQLGEKVTSLTSGVQKAGTYSVSFNTSSLRLSSGIYLYVINARSLDGTKVFNNSKKMMLVK